MLNKIFKHQLENDEFQKWLASKLDIKSANFFSFSEKLDRK